MSPAFKRASFRVRLAGGRTLQLLKFSCPALQVAQGLETAVNQVLDDGFRTGDIMQEGCTKVGCTEMGDKL